MFTVARHGVIFKDSRTPACICVNYAITCFSVNAMQAQESGS